MQKQGKRLCHAWTKLSGEGIDECFLSNRNGKTRVFYWFLGVSAVI